MLNTVSSNEVKLVQVKCMRCPSGVVDRLRGKRKWPLLMALLVRAKCVRCPCDVVDGLHCKCSGHY
jgi:hypothetical protein